MVAKIITRKKNPEIVKNELLNFMTESDTVEEMEFNTYNLIDQGQAIDIINIMKR